MISFVVYCMLVVWLYLFLAAICWGYIVQLLLLNASVLAMDLLL